MNETPQRYGEPEEPAENGKWMRVPWDTNEEGEEFWFVFEDEKIDDIEVETEVDVRKVLDDWNDGKVSENELVDFQEHADEYGWWLE